MVLHASNNDKQPQSDLVYLMDDRTASFRTGLIDASFEWVSPEQSLECGSSPVINPTWGTWRGYDQSCPFDFKWRSCSGSVLTACKRTGDADRYMVECTPSNGRTLCGYMDLFSLVVEVSFEEVLDQPAAIEESRDVEPDWPSMDLVLSRPASGC